MSLSRERLLDLSATTGFRQEIIDKVVHLLALTEALMAHSRLRGALALKGGTALNLFVLSVPRLSIDVDLNYIGDGDVESFQAQRPLVEQAIRVVCQREGFVVQRTPGEHAGGKWFLRYASAIGGGGNLAIDLNFMYRIPLWPVERRDSHAVGGYQARDIPLMDIHEIVAGKLVALLDRRAARDVFDTHSLLEQHAVVDVARLRLAFTVYLGAHRRDWRAVEPDPIVTTEKTLRDQLLPMLATDVVARIEDVATWKARLERSCDTLLNAVLPLAGNERAFLDRLLDDGKIAPELLTADPVLQDRIRHHPGLAWKALNVLRQRGSDRPSHR